MDIEAILRGLRNFSSRTATKPLQAQVMSPTDAALRIIAALSNASAFGGAASSRAIHSPILGKRVAQGFGKLLLLLTQIRSCTRLVGSGAWNSDRQQRFWHQCLLKKAVVKAARLGDRTKRNGRLSRRFVFNPFASS